MVRVVVYAEGAGEAAGQFTLLPSVGEPLRDEMLGAAHALTRRALAESWNLEPLQIRFDSPLRHRGHIAKGSDLLREATLRELLTWPRAEQQPDFAVVLVDADGDLQRRTRLRSIVQGLPGLRVLPLVAVAIQEFEAWLIADVQAVSGVLGGVDVSGASANPQGLPRGEAKRQLAELLGARGKGPEGRALRRSIAERCSLDTLAGVCRSFEAFLGDVRSLKR